MVSVHDYTISAKIFEIYPSQIRRDDTSDLYPVFNWTHFKIYLLFHPIRSNIPTASPLAIVKVQLRSSPVEGTSFWGNNFQARHKNPRYRNYVE